MTIRLLAELQDLFYRCKFSDLLSHLAKIEEQDGELGAELALLKANTLFELHDVEEARETLKKVSQRNDSFDQAYLYAAARLCYLDDRPRDARPLFEEILTHSDSATYQFKGLLGVANTHYTEGSFSLIPELITKLTAHEPLPRDDERISLLIFLGNYYFNSGASSELARQYFTKALGMAAAKTWTYFITRCLFGLAAVCEKTGATSELMWTLNVLQAFVNQSEQRYFSYIVNDTFKAYFSINTPMEFDTLNRRILIKNSWIAFHDRPLLFQFLLLLHDKGTFVEKTTIATSLWPEEGYKPRLHDPRIFDIAKRARHLIESYEQQPVVLLSGRMGYKLAST